MPVLKRAIRAVRRLLSRVSNFAWQRESLAIFRILPGQQIAVAPTLRDVAHSSMDAADLDAGEITDADFPGNLRYELRNPIADQRLHLVRVAGKPASWGFSVRPNGAWPLKETHTALNVENGAVCLFAFETLPEFRGRRLYPALLCDILSERFRDGATAAYIWCSPGNRASYSSIKRVGFVEIARHRYRRVLGLSFREVGDRQDLLTPPDGRGA